jgi:hypothetical protein
VVATFRQPFDILAETTAAVRCDAENTVKSAKSEIWLGRLDSNQGMAESKSAALPLGYAPKPAQEKPWPLDAGRGCAGP